LQALEERWVPSTLSVQNNLDSGAGSLRTEVALARSKDTIVFAPSLSGQTIALTGGELLVNKNLTIQGPGAGQVTVSSVYGRVFDIQAGTTATIAGLTIAGGTDVLSGAIGGGIYNAGTLTLSADTLSGNLAFQGGGIYNAGGAVLTVSGCTLSGNAALLSDHADVYGSGGGIFNAGSATVSNSTLSGNTTETYGTGGGIANLGGLTVTGCTLTGNSAYQGEGGGIFNTGIVGGGFLTVSYCTITGNTATFGGGIDNDPYASLTLKHSVVINNVGAADLALSLSGTATLRDDQIGYVIHTP
jgi:hypothetical protein